MKLSLRGDRALVDQARLSAARLRLGLSFGRFGDGVQTVTLRFSKTAAKGGTPSKRCEITVGLEPKRVKVEHTDVNLDVALDRAADKALRSVTRALEHEKEGRPRSLRRASRTHDGILTHRVT